MTLADFSWPPFVLEIEKVRRIPFIDLLSLCSSGGIVKHGNRFATFLIGFLGPIIALIVQTYLDYRRRAKNENPGVCTLEKWLGAIEQELGHAEQGVGTIDELVYAIENRVPAAEELVETKGQKLR